MQLTTEKKVLLASFVFVFLTFSVAAVLFEQHMAQTYVDANQPIGYHSLSSMSSSSRLKAVVKGSIYETGSNMTVFGACYDGDSYLLPAASAFFTAWYPNGSIMIGPNASMDRIYEDFEGFKPNGTGRWKIHVTMESTIGTYLTELRCVYQDQWATDLGEWQNPEWVKKIGDMYVLTSGIAGAVSNISVNLANLSSNVNQFRIDTSNDFSSVLAAINGIALNSTITEIDKTQKLMEIYNAVKDSKGQSWVLDTMNPTFSMGSGMNNWVAVDMLGSDAVYAVSADGKYQSWDGSVWTYGNMSGVVWHGVGMLEANMPYAWLVGEQGGQAVYSINGGNVTVFNENGSLVLYDVKVVRQPNVPGGFVYIFVVSDKGLFVTTNFGGSWTMVASFSGVAGSARMSKIVANLDLGATNGYKFAVVNDLGDILYYNGSDVVQSATGDSFIDVALVHGDVGYVVGTAANVSEVWRLEYVNGSLVLPEVYQWKAPYEVIIQWNNVSNVSPLGLDAFPVGIAAVAVDDVWVVTTDPSVFYHFDGFKWEYASYPYSKALSVIITFGNTTASTGLHDIVMSDGYNGYVVGDSGLILKYYSHVDSKLDSLFANLSAQLSSLNVSIGNFSGNLSIDNAAVLAAIASMNSSVTSMLSGLDSKIVQMNASVQSKLDTISSNVTYGNQYMETTIFPLLNGTYVGIQQILIDIGWLKVTANQTLLISNQTLQIVNQTDQKVDVLINRSNRPRVWTTQ